MSPDVKGKRRFRRRARRRRPRKSVDATTSARPLPAGGLLPARGPLSGDGFLPGDRLLGDGRISAAGELVGSGLVSGGGRTGRRRIVGGGLLLGRSRRRNGVGGRVGVGLPLRGRSSFCVSLFDGGRLLGTAGRFLPGLGSAGGAVLADDAGPASLGGLDPGACRSGATARLPRRALRTRATARGLGSAAGRAARARLRRGASARFALRRAPLLRRRRLPSAFSATGGRPSARLLRRRRRRRRRQPALERPERLDDAHEELGRLRVTAVGAVGTVGRRRSAERLAFHLAVRPTDVVESGSPVDAE